MATDGVLSLEVEQIDVTMGLPYLDPDWRFTDAAGHEHHYGEHGAFPTLHLIIDRRGTYWCEDCREEHESVASHYECLLCDEVVVPGTRVDTHRRFAPGRTSYLLDGRPISRERYEEILAERRAGG